MTCPNSTKGACPCAGARQCPRCAGCPQCCSCRKAHGNIASEEELRYRGGRVPPRRRPRPRPVVIGGYPAVPTVAVEEPVDVPVDQVPSSAGPIPVPTPNFTPIAVENPGGGRIRVRTPPTRAQIVLVAGVGGRRIPLHRLAAAAWQAMVRAARRDGIAAPFLLPTSGFRDPAHQERLWRDALRRYGSPQEARKWVAPPGGSAHQTGRAIDFYLGGRNTSANVAQLRTLPAYRWLVANAMRFGFYPYEREPWHWEYNPPAART